MTAQQQSIPSSPLTAQPAFLVDPNGNPVSNQDNIVLISQNAVGAGTYNSASQTNFTARGCKVYLNISAIGTGSVTVTIQGYDPVTNTFYTLLASTAKAATGFTVLEVYPGVTVAANASAATTLPRTWNCSAVAVASVGTVSFTVSASLVV